MASSYVTGMAQRNSMGELLNNTQNFIRQKWVNSSEKNITIQRNIQMKARPKQMTIKYSGTVDIMA